MAHFQLILKYGCCCSNFGARSRKGSVGRTVSKEVPRLPATVQEPCETRRAYVPVAGERPAPTRAKHPFCRFQQLA